MGERTEKDQEHHYICGQCGNEQYALTSEELPDVCVDCGWVHRAKRKYDLPSEIKLDLNNYG